MIYELSLGTHEKYVPLILRIMFGKPLDIFKYGKAAQIRRVEMDVIELEGDLVVPQISSAQHMSPLPAPQQVAICLDPVSNSACPTLLSASLASPEPLHTFA
jgi:hypothetical protein